MTRATARVGGVKLAYYVRGAGPPVLFVMVSAAGAERRQAARGASRAGVELGASEQRSARERTSSGRAPK